VEEFHLMEDKQGSRRLETRARRHRICRIAPSCFLVMQICQRDEQ
jgi:hypothetical protein